MAKGLIFIYFNKGAFMEFTPKEKESMVGLLLDCIEIYELGPDSIEWQLVEKMKREWQLKINSEV